MRLSVERNGVARPKRLTDHLRADESIPERAQRPTRPVGATEPGAGTPAGNTGEKRRDDAGAGGNRWANGAREGQ